MVNTPSINKTKKFFYQTKNINVKHHEKKLGTWYGMGDCTGNEAARINMGQKKAMANYSRWAPLKPQTTYQKSSRLGRLGDLHFNFTKY